ncbi:MAG: hypothetical protein V1914_04430 [archaeon]
MPNEVPTDEVLTLQRAGKSTSDITKDLETKGYSLQNINDAINQANIKSGVEGAVPQAPKAAADVETMQESILQPPTAPTPTPEAMPPSPEATPTPMYPQVQPSIMQQPLMPAEPNINYEDIQALVEEVIDEKWKELISKVGDIPTWKSEISNDTEAIKQELLRVEKRFEDLQTAIFGKVKEYGSSMKDLGSEMKAMEKVFEKILEPMTTNIRELERLTTQLKERK